MDNDKNFTVQNTETNLDDSNGRAIWALGYLISLNQILPPNIVLEAESIIKKSLVHIENIYSTRTMAFAIKGLFYYQNSIKSIEISMLIQTLANRLVQMYKHESNKNWEWFESYLTYTNSTHPKLCYMHGC
jgi:hypothetical protein